jgi:hypothetical protein
MSRHYPKFRNGEYVKIISKRSKYRGFVCKFIDYTNGYYDDICAVRLGDSKVIYIKEYSIVPLTDVATAKTHYAESAKRIYDSHKKEILQLEESIY